MRRAWILPALVLACSRENPGFELAEAGGEATTGAAASSGPDAATTLDARTTGPGTTGEPQPLCPQWPESALDLTLLYGGVPLAPPEDCSTVVGYRGHGTLSTSTLTLADDSTCGENLTGEFKVKVGHVAINFPIADACFEVQVEWAADCSAIRSVLLLTYAPLFPQNTEWFAAGVVGSASAPPGAPPELTPTPTLAQACSCDPAGDECCAPADTAGPGSYDLYFEAADLELAPGETAAVTLGATTYTLANLRSHVHADCIDAPRHLDWYALRNTI